MEDDRVIEMEDDRVIEMEDNSYATISTDLLLSKRELHQQHKNQKKLKMSIPGSETGSNGDKNSDNQIQFHVGQMKELFVEWKTTLAVASPVFKAMLDGELKTSGPIEVPDVESEAFKTILEFLNGKMVKFLNSDHAAKVCYAADKYDLPELTQLCAEYLFPMNIDDMWIALECGVMFNIKFLTDAALDILRENSAHILSSRHLLQLPAVILHTVIQADYLFVNNEVKILQAVIYWAKHQCDMAEKPRTQANQREMLDDVVQHLRFLNMNKTDIMSTAREILTQEEIENILKCPNKEINSCHTSFLCSNKEKRKQFTQPLVYSNIVHNINFVCGTSYSILLSNNIESQKIECHYSINIISLTVLARFQAEQLDDKHYFENLVVELEQNGTLYASGKFMGRAYYNGSIRIPLRTREGKYPLVKNRGTKSNYEIIIKPQINIPVFYQKKLCKFNEGENFQYMPETYSHIIGIEYINA